MKLLQGLTSTRKVASLLKQFALYNQEFNVVIDYIICPYWVDKGPLPLYGIVIEFIKHTEFNWLCPNDVAP